METWEQFKKSTNESKSCQAHQHCVSLTQKEKEDEFTWDSTGQKKDRRKTSSHETVRDRRKTEERQVHTTEDGRMRNQLRRTQQTVKAAEKTTKGDNQLCHRDNSHDDFMCKWIHLLKRCSVIRFKNVYVFFFSFFFQETHLDGKNVQTLSQRMGLDRPRKWALRTLRLMM